MTYHLFFSLLADVHEAFDHVLDEIENKYHTKIDYPVAEFIIVVGKNIWGFFQATHSNFLRNKWETGLCDCFFFGSSTSEYQSLDNLNLLCLGFCIFLFSSRLFLLFLGFFIVLILEQIVLDCKEQWQNEDLVARWANFILRIEEE